MVDTGLQGGAQPDHGAPENGQVANAELAFHGSQDNSAEQGVERDGGDADEGGAAGKLPQLELLVLVAKFLHCSDELVGEQVAYPE